MKYGLDKLIKQKKLLYIIRQIISYPVSLWYGYFKLFWDYYFEKLLG